MISREENLPQRIAKLEKELAELRRTIEQRSAAGDRPQSVEMLPSLEVRYPGCIRPEITSVRLVVSKGRCYLEITTEEMRGGYLRDYQTKGTDLGFVSGDSDGELFFEPADGARNNAKKFLKDFDAISIINCTDLFTDEASEKLYALQNESMPTSSVSADGFIDSEVSHRPEVAGGQPEIYEKEVIERLLKLAQEIPPERLFPTLIPEASVFATSNPYAFTIAACLDRGTRAEIIWTIPFALRNALGHLDPFRVLQLSLEELGQLMSSLPQRPRYTRDAPRTIRDLTAVVCNECQGDASRLWTGRRASQVRDTFLRIYGVGPGIANMAVLLIEKAFGFRFDDLDHSQMNIKPDVHTVRVLYRLGLSDAPEAVACLRAVERIHPEYPGELDAPLWILGRDFCRPSNPACTGCVCGAICAKRGL